VRIARELLDEMVAHAREDAPNECCGMVASHDGRAVRVYRARNEQASPFRYVVDGRDLLRVTDEIDDAGLRLGAIYHSHVRSEPYPSQTDINLALTPDGASQVWPGTLYFIVGLQDEEVRAWDIRPGGEVAEVSLEVE
jgi:proteasome lid subunit RPN8/RPN11